MIQQQRQLATSTTHLAQELLMNIQCIGGSRGFAKKMRVLKMRSISGWPSEVDNDQLRRSSKTILLLYEKLPKNSKLIILYSFGI